MNVRDKGKFQQFLKSEQEEQMRPVKEAVAALEKTNQENYDLICKMLVTQPDPRLETDAVPEWVRGLKINYDMTTVREGLGDALTDGAFEDAVKEFKQIVPEFIPTEKNMDLIIAYLNANSLDPCDYRSLMVAFDMLHGAYMLDTAESLAAEEAHRNPQPKEYTPEEIERMSSKEYREKILEPQFADAPPAPEPTPKTEEELADDALTAEQFKNKHRISWARSWGRN